MPLQRKGGGRLKQLGTQLPPSLQRGVERAGDDHKRVGVEYRSGESHL